ncbi:Putative DNA-directed RNA polymerase subunit beta [Thermobacillus xylanilyticus]|jgi:hypothetical protein|uniref:DNA-directed RNA polymerase subunit beta n=2 Tax=Thermobacillus TaxID=76632 RepID=L0EJE3_THECK|nr:MULTISPECIES: DNA-directed RNA polymerase subunit beta [Thermobacillus]AGA59846.1 DNA-directed RNA polymerase subunit beta [Thermobacillus composti KWC4]REJ11867.1 MAG: DNA-directed RNA polymerase subunit beta [Paenibacillaceae bacterium]CAG5091455.1 Putative DNA-directed RNA polymerase subunit beta [Thermobacillus xylanilyticus]
MINGQDRPKAPARETEPVRTETAARPVRPAGESGTGAKRPSEGGSGKPGKPRRHPAVRALLRTLRAAIVPLLLIAALIAGLYIGYTKLGGGSPDDVWNWETWKHMYDLIFAES